ncbi:hypothetical protein Pla175_35270 [Pirellulimonas nuda]|uniref:Addiction module killer protein n=1 Tax=Pirellulimonas nuda TaxID=2528009 RepID=A0A518DF88_9BACT|nr:type II toxin-antitoxin system RelE/ParE family toxin [Pirellulimonas nuda]QDU90126.1 hypothetical protein Pla175_35270 [Pirellulimonas nuda]
MFDVIEFQSPDGEFPFRVWFDGLNRQAALKVQARLARIEAGNLGDGKPVGSGVSETRIDFGPGYRVYFGRDGQRLVVLLGGGTKQRQRKDIADALARWNDYKESRRRSRDA